MIRLRSSKGEVKEIDIEEYPFVELVDYSGEIMTAFLVSEDQVLKIDEEDIDSKRYSKLFDVTFSKKRKT